MGEGKIANWDVDVVEPVAFHSVNISEISSKRVQNNSGTFQALHSKNLDCSRSTGLGLFMKRKNLARLIFLFNIESDLLIKVAVIILFAVNILFDERMTKK